MATLQLDLLAPAVQRDPYAAYRMLQDEAPVHWSPPWGWLVTRHVDVTAALQEPKLTATGAIDALFETVPAQYRQEFSALRTQLTFWLGNRCPVEHTHVRSLLRPAFSAATVASYRPVSYALAARLLDAIDGRQSFDAVAEFARPLPAQVIAQILGADTVDQSRFEAWSRTLTEFLGFGMLDQDVMRRAQAAVVDMMAFLGAILDNADEGSSGLMRQGAEWIGDGQIARDDFLSNCVLLLFAGHETTTITISNTLWLLLRHPHVLEGVRADRSRLPAIVQESLRCESPVQMVRRRAEEDIVIGGQRLKKGDFVWLMLGAANHDSRVFPDPDRFDPSRRNTRNLAFGFGRHYCLGAPLSLVEVEEAVRAFLDACPSVALECHEPAWLLNPATRALQTLRVRRS